MLHKNGTRKYMAFDGRIGLNEDGSFKRTHCILRDETERKQAEERLKASEKLLAETESIGKVGGWSFNIDTMEQKWTDEVYRIHEIAIEPNPSVVAGINYYTNASRPIIEKAVQRAIEHGEDFDLDLEIVTAKGNTRAVHTIGRADLENRRVYGFFQDITERKHAEEELKRFKTISDIAVYGNAIADLHGNFVHVNRFFANIHGYEPEELIGKHFSLFHNERQMDSVNNLIASLIQQGVFAPTTVWHCHKDGAEFPMLMSGTLLKDGIGNPQYIAASAVDISSQMQAEERYRLLFHLSNDAILVHEMGDDDRPSRNIEVNEQATRLLGYTREELLNMSARDVVPEKHASTMYLHGKELKEKKHLTFETENIRSDGVVIPIEVSAHLHTEGNRKFVVSSIRDITDRKQTEEALHQERNLLLSIIDSIPDSIFVKDTDGRKKIVNRANCRQCGFENKEDVIGKHDFEMFPPEIARPFFEDDQRVLKHGERVVNREERLIMPNGETAWQLTTKLPMFDREGKIIGLVGIGHDITGRKLAEEEIAKQLAEKEILLREVHHRVKNNIANIESLLSLQAGSTANTEVKVALRVALSRVKSMRVLYDKLLLSDDLHGVSVKNYAEGLIDSLIMAFDPENNITIEMNIADFEVDAKKAFTIGIIINELLTNVFKYAFNDREDGRVSVSIEKEEGNATLIIQDDGIGIDERSLNNESTGFGLTIVKMLAEQLGGSCSISNDNGAKSVVSFGI